MDDLPELYAQLWPVLHAQAQLALRVWRRPRIGDEDAEDLAMRAVEHLFGDDARVLRTWNPAQGSLKSWAARVAKNLYIDRMRLEGRRGELFAEHLERLRSSPAPAPATPESLVGAQEQWDRVLACIRARIDRPEGLAILAELLTPGQTDDMILARHTGLTREALFRWRNRIKTLEQECRAKIERGEG